MRKVQAGTFLVSAEESLIAAAPSSVSGSTAHPGVVSVGLGWRLRGGSKGRDGAGRGWDSRCSFRGISRARVFTLAGPLPGGLYYIVPSFYTRLRLNARSPLSFDDKGGYACYLGSAPICARIWACTASIRCWYFELSLFQRVCIIKTCRIYYIIGSFCSYSFFRRVGDCEGELSLNLPLGDSLLSWDLLDLHRALCSSWRYKLL